jgi:hypothetical protein
LEELKENRRSVSSVDGLVITAGTDTIAETRDLPDKGSYDAVYILDKRGWYHGFFPSFLY